MDNEQEMVDREVAGLRAKSQEAGIIREFCQHPGFQIWRKELEAKMSDLKGKWFTSNEQDGEKLKLRAQVYSEMLDILKAKMLVGDAASKRLREIESDQPQ